MLQFWIHASLNYFTLRTRCREATALRASRSDFRIRSTGDKVMTLDIAFYQENTVSESEAMIELSQNLYENLIKSDFVEIGKTLKKTIKSDDEEVEIEVIDLDKGTITNRQRLIDFFKEKIIKESRTMLEKLGNSPSKKEYNQHSSDLRKLHEILKHLEDSQYQYLAKTP